MIQVFAKSPLPGKVKTRLIPALGEFEATRLYEAMLQRTLCTVMKADCGKTVVLGLGDTELLSEIVAPYGYPVQQQQGSDLGERMFNAASTSLRTEPGVILIGTDCPALNRDYLQRAMRLLESGNDAVLGPAEDGGYVLLALARVDRKLFSGIDWGSDRVLAQTRSRLDELGWRVTELSPLWDVDRIEDIHRLRATIPEFTHQWDTPVQGE